MSKKVNDEKSSKLAELLQTDNPEEQAVMVGRLLELAQLPTIGILITKDFRSGKVTVQISGGSVPYDAVYDMLDQARKIVLQEERKGQAQKDKEPAQ